MSYDNPRYKLTPERARALIDWFEDHKTHPYPTRQEKMVLCRQTQLTFTQVNMSQIFLVVLTLFQPVFTLETNWALAPCYLTKKTLGIHVEYNHSHTFACAHLSVQVSTWFANARRRMKKSSQEEDENSTGDESSGSEQTDSSSVAPSWSLCSLPIKHPKSTQTNWAWKASPWPVVTDLYLLVDSSKAHFSNCDITC